MSNITQQPDDCSHPGMSLDPAERGRILGEENAAGGQSVGTGGHGNHSGTGGHCGGSQPVGGYHAIDSLYHTEAQLHPGMNPDQATRGAQLGHENTTGYRSAGTGGHGTKYNGTSGNDRGQHGGHVKSHAPLHPTEQAQKHDHSDGAEAPKQTI